MSSLSTSHSFDTQLGLSHVSFAWPDGASLLADATLTFPPGLTGMVGANGAGKSTLLRLLAGELSPDSGTLSRAPDLRYVPQDVTLDASRRADAVCGLDRIRDAMRAIEGGSVDQRHYDVMADNWDAEARAVAVFASLGLPDSMLERRVGELSGGETTLLALAAALLARPDVLLLDEPTNNLDARATEQVVDQLRRRGGITVVVSHDREVLNRVDHIAELRRGGLRLFGGALSDYEQALEVERHRAEQDLRTAKSEVSRQHRELRSYLEGAAKRARVGAKKAESMPKILASGKKRQAQATLARVTAVHEDRLETARDELSRAREATDRDREIKVALPETAVPSRRDVALLDGCVLRTGTVVDALVQGPERIVLSGRNGSGKTTLIHTLLGRLAPLGGNAAVAVPHGLLPQRLDVLDPSLSVVDNVRAAAAEASPHEVREALARFLFRGAAGEALASTLSGGERFRASLATVLLARPAPQLLVLDEPTNNLDFASLDHLLEALADYRGALLVVSHDAEFVDALQPTREWLLDEGFTDRPLK